MRWTGPRFDFLQVNLVSLLATAVFESGRDVSSGVERRKYEYD